jgi:uncharacterized membrane protein
MRKLIAVFFVILLSSGVFAQLDYFVPTIDVFSDGSTETTISVTLTESAEIFKMSLFNTLVSTINTTSDFQGFSCNIDEKIYGADLTCDVSTANQNTRSFTIFYKSKNPAFTDGSEFLLEREFFIPYDAKSFYGKVVLPEGMVLTDQIYLPDDGEVSSDGRRIVVFWRRENIQQGNAFGIKVSYEPSFPEIPYEFIIFGLLAATVIYLIARRKSAPTKSIVMPILKNDEKLVLKGVLKYGDGVNQKMLVKESGYSKAKVSKVLKNLTERNIVRLERVGRSNRVYLVRQIAEDDQ